MKQNTFSLACVILLLIISFGYTSCQSNTETHTKSTSETVEKSKDNVSFLKDIDAAAFKDLIGEENMVLLDVRTEAEVTEGKIPGAAVIDFRSPDFRQNIEKLDKSKTYLVYCRSGNRSGQACNIMKEMGFEKLYNLEGGYMEWPYKGE